MARNFDLPSSQFLRIFNDSDLQPTTAVTVMCWCRPAGFASTNTAQYIISKLSSYQLRFFNQGGFEGWVWTIFSSTGTTHVERNSIPTLGRWYHVAGVYDGSDMKIREYDSVTGVTTNYTTAKTGTIDTNTNSLTVGNHPTPATNFQLEGDVAHVRVWKDVALTDEQIDQCRFSQGNLLSPVLYLPLMLDGGLEPDWSGLGKTSTLFSVGTSTSNPPIGPWFGYDYARKFVPAVEIIQPATGALKAFNGTEDVYV